MRFMFLGLSALALVISVGCESSDDSSSMSGGATMGASGAPADRLAALEAQMANVGVKRAWSGRYFQGRTVTGLTPSGSDLFAAVFNPETRENELHCLDLRTGVPRWLLVFGAVPLKFPPMAGDRFVTLILDQGAGTVVVNRMTGAREFKIVTPFRVLPSGPAASSDSTLYVASLVDSRVHAVDPESGRSGWHFRTDGTVNAGPVVTPRLPRRVVVSGTDSGEVLALPSSPWNEPGPDAPVWRRRLLGDVNGAITVAERTTPGGVEVSLLIPCEDGGLYCLDVATGESRWVARTESAFSGTARAAGGKAFCRNATRMVAVDLATGQQAWASGADAGGSVQEYEMADDVLAANDDRVYVVMGGRKVLRLDAKTGATTAAQLLDAFDMVVPAPAVDLLVAATSDGHIVAYR